MCRYALVLLAAVLPAAAQLREVTIELQPTDCATCTESLPARMARVRGVAQAEMRDAPVRAVVRLESENRVRLTRLLDVVRQDGTGVVAVGIEAAGEVFEEQGWRFRILPGDASFALTGELPQKAGRIALKGRILPPFEAVLTQKLESLP